MTMKGVQLAIFLALCLVPIRAFEYRKFKPHAPFRPPRGYSNGCAPPREGLWHFQNNFQLEGPEEGYMVSATSELTIMRVAENVYNATGLLDTANSAFTDTPVSLVALFNPSTCYLSGSGFAPSTSTVDSVTWWSTGKTLYGWYLVAQNAVLISPLIGISNATFVG